MDNLERNSPVQSIQPVRKIRARLYDGERQEPNEKRNRRLQVTKRKKPDIKLTEHLTDDAKTPGEIEQDFVDYKSDLIIRSTFDRAQILNEEPSSD